MTAEGALAPEGKVSVYDGVGMLRRGDTVLMVYQKPARLHRTRWLFDFIDAALTRIDGDILGFLIVLSTADPPDGPTRQENTVRLRKIGSRVRRLVTTPIGDAFWMSVVRAVMRGLNIALGYSSTRFVTDSVEKGLAQLLEVKSSKTPSAQQILADLDAIYLALGEPDPKFSKTRPAEAQPTV
ncbi:MAG TPA: hypothetical protein VGP93_20640, partial [Polyangiaceae bacterium]|nr:hypothetical protein [Polyangiaceae bacterium]